MGAVGKSKGHHGLLLLTRWLGERYLRNQFNTLRGWAAKSRRRRLRRWRRSLLAVEFWHRRPTIVKARTLALPAENLGERPGCQEPLALARGDGLRCEMRFTPGRLASD